MLAILLVFTSQAPSQENASSGDSEPSAAAAKGPTDEKPLGVVPRVKGPLTPAGPDTFILLDAQGRPQPILGMTYEEFVEAWKKLRELDDASAEPAYVINSLTATGRVEGDVAVLDVRLEIEVRSAGLTEVPLGFSGAILRNLDERTTALQLSYDEDRGGYLAWVRGNASHTAPSQAAASKTVVVNLPLLVPLEQEGDRTTLEANLPRALVNQLVLDTPERIVSAAVSEGAVVRLSEQESQRSRMTVTGLVGDIVLSWQVPSSQATELETVLSVEGQIATSVDGRSARSEAILRVESFGRKFQRFRLRLPPGAQLISQGMVEAAENEISYTLIAPVSPAKADDIQQRGQVYVVEFAEATSGPVDVRLVTQQALGLTRENPLTELAGFEVIGAVRQFGKLALRVDSDWQLRWNRLVGGRQTSVDELDQEPPTGQALFAFEYYQQPWSLPVEAEQRDTRVAVSPKYRLELTPEEARLQVTLQYQLAGSQEMQFWVNLAGWHVTPDPIEPTRLIDANHTREINADKLSIEPENALNLNDPVQGAQETVLELRLTQPASRRTEITFQLRRPLDKTQKTLRLPLPTPLVDSIGTGELVVLADPSLIVTPRLEQQGLAARPLTNETEPNNDTGLTQVAAYRSFLDRLAFSADVATRAGEVQATINTKLRVDSQRTQVDHVLSFDAKYQPLSELQLLVPAALMRDPSLRLTLLTGSGDAGSDQLSEGIPLDFRPSAGDDGFSQPFELITVTLPQPRLGQFRLRAVYSVTSGIDTSGIAAPLAIPLITPSRMPVASQTATVSGRGLGQLELVPSQQDTTWTVMPVTDSTATEQLALESAEPSNELSLLFRPVRIAGEGRTVVEQVWLQSWIAASTHQQRIVYRLRSNDSSLVVELPLQAAGQDVEVVLDNQPLLVYERSEAQIIIPLPESNESVPHTLELRYLEETGLDAWDELSVDLPQVGGESQFAQFYWQIVMPHNYWIVKNPRTLARGFDWRWSLSGWRPISQKSTRSLERASEALERRQPATGEAEYLYTGLGPGKSLEVQVIRSELVHLTVAGGVLAAGLALLFVPLLRRPAILFAVAVALTCTGAAYPELLLIGGPALTIGVALAILGGLLYLLVPRREALESTVAPSTFVGSRPPSREKFLTGSVGAASSNAPTITLRHSESNA